MISLLYVDDEPVLLDLCRTFLEREGDITVTPASSAKDALKSLAAGKYDAIVSDYQMPDTDGIMFLRTVRSQFPDIPFILFTGRGREEVVIEAINSGADSYVAERRRAKSAVQGTLPPDPPGRAEAKSGERTPPDEIFRRSCIGGHPLDAHEWRYHLL
jgi:Response regulator containing CheY-like receiver, AAA-type ATPase, and DNA-binding domains